QKALDLVRCRGLAGTKVKHFSPGNSSEDLWEPLAQLVKHTDATWVYHVLGQASRELDSCVVWDEDLLEFLLALNSSFRDNRLPHLFAALEPEKNNELLAIGVSYSDWLLRFFMRVMRQTRLTDDHSNNHLVPPTVVDPQNLVLFCGGPAGSVRVLNLAPQEFVQQLLSRWRERQPQSPAGSASGPQLTVADEMRPGAIFVSYMREDEVAVRELVRRLQAAGCEIWLDVNRLKSGMNFDQRIEDYIRSRCALFVSVISTETERVAEGYAHREREWARQRCEGIAEAERDRFYHPLLIADLDPGRVRLEPRLFAAAHRPKFLNGEVDDDFCQRLRRLQLERMASGTLR
ncbi:MAG: toll/interleukin-1 receptor domain-containing protein, partial [Planctomycetaceae bacterium]